MDDSAKKITVDINSEPISPETDKKKPANGLHKAKSRRTGKDRRVFKYTIHVPERRSGLDRRGIGWYRN